MYCMRSDSEMTYYSGYPEFQFRISKIWIVLYKRCWYNPRRSEFNCIELKTSKIWLHCMRGAVYPETSRFRLHWTQDFKNLDWIVWRGVHISQDVYERCWHIPKRPKFNCIEFGLLEFRLYCTREVPVWPQTCTICIYVYYIAQYVYTCIRTTTIYILYVMETV